MIFTNFSYHASGDEKALEKCENEISICQRKTDELNQKRKDLQKTINQLREQLANAEVIYSINILNKMELQFYLMLTDQVEKV